MHQPIDKPVVVIGYGSTLRGDDAVGRLVVKRFAHLERENVMIVSVTQLVPEIAPLIAQARMVIFVDASIAAHANCVALEELKGENQQAAMAHHAGPRELLILATACYGESPPAWLVSVPASDVELSDKVSLAAQRNVDVATQVIERLIVDLPEHEVARA